MKQLLKSSWFLFLLFGCVLSGTLPLYSRDYSGVLSDELTLGKYLYQSRCVRCHGSYDEAAIAENYNEVVELAGAIGDGGCRISWRRNGGGEFNRQELHALAVYMLAFEEDGADPVTVQLPPLLPEEIKDINHQKTKATAKTVVQPEKIVIAPVYKKLMDQNPVAHGGWLYTNNCYRCHLSYKTARMGRGLTRDAVTRFINEGKTSTQMKPFSRMLGGNLKTGEIAAITTYIMSWEQRGEELALSPFLMKPPALDPADFKPVRLTRFKRISGDRGRGSQIYASRCGQCHGGSGEGYVGASLVETGWTMRPDLYMKSVIKSGIPSSLMIGWDQASGGPLSARDIDDLVAHLDQLSAQ